MALCHHQFAPKVKEIQSCYVNEGSQRINARSRTAVPERLGELEGFVDDTLPLFIIPHFGVTLDNMGIVNTSQKDHILSKGSPCVAGGPQSLKDRSAAISSNPWNVP